MRRDARKQQDTADRPAGTSMPILALWPTTTASVTPILAFGASIRTWKHVIRVAPLDSTPDGCALEPNPQDDNADERDHCKWAEQEH